MLGERPRAWNRLTDDGAGDLDERVALMARPGDDLVAEAEVRGADELWVTSSSKEVLANRVSTAVRAIPGVTVAMIALTAAVQVLVLVHL